MAVVQKETVSLNVYVNDDMGGTTTFKLDNPIMNGDDAVTMQKVNDVFNPMITAGIWCNANNFIYTGVERADIVETVIRTTSLS